MKIAGSALWCAAMHCRVFPAGDAAMVRSSILRHAFNFNIAMFRRVFFTCQRGLF